MPRGEGTFMTSDRWAARLAPTLPGSAGWVLLELSYQSNYEDKTLTVGDLMKVIPTGERAIQKGLKCLIELGHVMPVPNEKAYLIVGACTDLARSVRSNQRARWERKNAQDSKNPFAYSEINRPLIEGIEKGKKEGRKAAPEEVIPDASLPASPPAQDLEIEQQRADARTADAATQASPSQGSSELIQANEETATPLVGVNTSRAARRAELPPLPVTPAAAAFTEICGAFFAKVQALHLTRWHGQYSPEFITLAWRLSALEEKPTYAFADWLDRSPGKPWPDALRHRYELDVAPELAQTGTAAVKPRELPVKPGDLVRWADGQTATVERCQSVDFVTDHEDDARGYVPYSAIGRSVEVLHS